MEEDDEASPAGEVGLGGEVGLVGGGARGATNPTAIGCRFGCSLLVCGAPRFAAIFAISVFISSSAFAFLATRSCPVGCGPRPDHPPGGGGGGGGGIISPMIAVMAAPAWAAATNKSATDIAPVACLVMFKLLPPTKTSPSKDTI